MAMEISNDEYCLVCGERNPIGLKMKPETDEVEGTAQLTLVLPDEYQGWQGFAHGGVIAALLDEVSAYAAMTRAQPIVTAELQVRYLKPVPTGKPVRARAQVVHQRGRTVAVDSTLTQESVVLAHGKARLVAVRWDSTQKEKR